MGSVSDKPSRVMTGGFSGGRSQSPDIELWRVGEISNIFDILSIHSDKSGNYECLFAIIFDSYEAYNIYTCNFISKIIYAEICFHIHFKQSLFFYMATNRKSFTLRILTGEQRTTSPRQMNQCVGLEVMNALQITGVSSAFYLFT